MKSIFKSLFVLAVLAVSFSSCKKEYTCECTFTDTSKNFSVKLGSQYKNDAKVVCEDYSAYVGNCSLK